MSSYAKGNYQLLHFSALCCLAFVITLDTPTIHPRNWPFGGETMLSTYIHPRNWLFCGQSGEIDGNGQKKGVFMAAKVADPKETPSKGCLCNMHTITRRFSAASSASARLSKKAEAAGTPDPNKVSGRHAPNRGCQRQLTGVEIVAKKKLG